MSNTKNNKDCQLLLANLIHPFHCQFFSPVRLKKLAVELSKFLPIHDSIGLDIGCGAGELVAEISSLCPQLDFSAVDILDRQISEAYTSINFQTYDGKQLPFTDNSFSFSMLIDVLHHTDNPHELLSEAKRVTADFILIKDHICDSSLDKLALISMDWVGNKSYGIRLPYNYLSMHQWRLLFADLQLEVEEKRDKLELYCPPVSWLFGANLHFIAKLKVRK